MTTRKRTSTSPPIRSSTAVQHLRELSPLYEMVQEGIDLSTIEWSGH